MNGLAAPRRICVHGPSGSGKTTLAARVAARLGVAHVELDAIVHQPGWTELPTPALRARVAAFAAGPAWVSDGNYASVRDLLWARAQLIVVLDPPRWRTTARILRRTVVRGVRRTELWNGNREELGNLFSLDPARNVVLWSVRTQRRYRTELPAAARELGGPEVVVVRSDHQIDALVAGLAGPV